MKRSKEFAQYFKKTLSNQKINNDPHKLFSEGKGLYWSDLSHFKSVKELKFSLSLVLTFWIEV